MKPTVKSISKSKFYRLFQSNSVTKVHAKIFNENTWEVENLFPAFEIDGFIYAGCKTNEKGYDLCYKRYPKGYVSSDRTKALMATSYSSYHI